MKYLLYYWPEIQGRGEFVRLALEEGGADYVDVARLSEEEGGGVPAMMRFMEDAGRPPFAPPFLVAGRQAIAQTANILLFLGPRLGLVPRDAAGKLWVHQLQLTLADLVVEAHDTHHPLGPTFYYEDQEREAKRRTRAFIAERIPKFLDYFERVIERNPGRGPWMVGSAVTYADLSMAQVIAGLRFAFPNATRKALARRPRLAKLHDAVFARPRIRRYADSGRRIPFNNDGLFRRYRELGG
ncbi:MAG TPA: glutathione S-transferase [Usitatibacter sp.]|nr:glutathione S-transferase [Usitatibacter sp.]